ncbi:MAG TPA: BamA/TamA family outer membrane protein, partial [Vicinamibacterales bacterium]|nr:BamA/TamA family outer membrane protein [Vicinamibacterales bacterium]
VAVARAFQDLYGAVRVVFVVASLQGDQDPQPNINARYTVEHVEIRGIPEGDLATQLRAELQGLVGKRLDSDEARQFEERLRAALPDYDVRRRIVRGSRSGQICLLFVLSRAESARWLPFLPLKSKFVYHSDQGWGGVLDIPISTSNIRVTPIIALDNGDDLIEEYSGFGIRVETRKLGTERLGASLEWSTFDPSWQGETLTALDMNPRVSGAYDNRSTVTPLMTFALSPWLRVAGGVSICELEPLSDFPESQMANVVVASIGYGQRWRQASGPSHRVDAAFTLRASSEALESDLDYTRSFGQGLYRYRRGHHSVLVSGMGGGISGDAPLFERFSLGDSQTLRGWNKYDIAPAGGDLMFHASVEYRYRGLAFFLDNGSVWDRETDSRWRVSTGVGLHSDPVFFTVGFPLNAEGVSAVFTMGIRFSGVEIRSY